MHETRLPPHDVKFLPSRLSALTSLTEAEENVLAEFNAQRVRNVTAHRDVIEEGNRPTVLYLVQEGWACGYKRSEDGRRQITAFFLPGDACPLDLLFLDRMGYSIGSITPLVVSEVTRRAFEQLATQSPKLAQAFWREMLLNFSIQQEWMVNIAQRGAFERVAHLICELFLRLRQVGMTDDDGCEWPLTQTDLADALGLTGIHTNRMVQQMRSEGLVVLKDRWLTIPDFKALQQVAGFDPDYLYLSDRG